MKKALLTTLTPLLLIGCSSITPIGAIGPNKLGVYSIKESGFLSESKMLVILDKKGNVAAYSGGTVSGVGTVGLQTAGTLATAGAVVVGAKSIQHGLENAKVSGVPSNFDVKTHSTVDVTGAVKGPL
tara:strand:+ start:787 stop:1167 length:381 start_codon:yes stop_codon:yes gene_type:complete